ncbi:GntP family permease [Auritidibacter ignavus]|uniref:GntP family permease n=1 Tax=Auritidibacter ignavus TaxID=678932 RepID=UPI0016BBACD9|nr:H+/gluconate symporter-like permease [Auritidibacter ignavus]
MAAPISAFVAMLLSGVPLLPTFTEIFMPGVAGFISNYFLIFLTGAIFGALMLASGYATALAQVITKWLGPKRAVFATVLTSALMTYGGISVFVAAFVMFPLARELFKAANLPRRLVPSTIALGILTFTMTAIPGAPQIQNIIPGQFFGTSTFAAPLIGIVAGILMFVLGMVWLEYRSRALVRKGESFGDTTILESKFGRGADLGLSQPESDQEETREGVRNVASPPRASEDSPDAEGKAPRTLVPPNNIVPFIPFLLVFIVNFGCTMFVFPALDWSVLEDEKFGGITLADRSATWAVLLALLAAILSVLLFNIRRIRNLWASLIDGAKNSLQPIFNTASEVGYGAVIASLGAFTIIRDGIFGVSSNALITSAVSTSVISGVTGSASGGMTIALNAFGPDFAEMAEEQGISMEALHRITSMASGGLDSMPHNGAVITLLLVCGMSHKESYKDVCVITLLIPVVVTAIMIPFAMIL